jgi:hypothetical protein
MHAANAASSQPFKTFQAFGDVESLRYGASSCMPSPDAEPPTGYRLYALCSDGVTVCTAVPPKVLASSKVLQDLFRDVGDPAYIFGTDTSGPDLDIHWFKADSPAVHVLSDGASDSDTAVTTPLPFKSRDLVTWLRTTHKYSRMFLKSMMHNCSDDLFERLPSAEI